MASCICFGSKQNDRDDQRDKISQLSDDIIHHILRSTNSTKTAARTSLLSRRWRDLWRCYPVLEFHGGGDSCSVGKERASSFFSPRRWRNSCPSPAAEEAASFCRFVAAASRRLPLLVPLPLVEFRISIVSESCHDYLDQLLLSICRCLSSSSSSTSPLSPGPLVDFTIEAGIESYYQFPRGMAFPEHTRVVNLVGCDLTDSISNVSSLGMLRVVHLNHVALSEQLLRSFLTSAPLLESLRLEDVCCISRLAIASTAKSLKTIQIRGLSDLQEIRLATAAPVLETLEIDTVCGLVGLAVEHSFSAPNLRVLKILGVFLAFTMLDLHEFVSRCSPSLDTLCLDVTRRGRVRLSAPKLRTLTLEDAFGSEVRRELKLEFEIDATDLVTLNFTTSPAGFPLSNLNLVNVASTCRCFIQVPEATTRQWLIELRQFLFRFSSSSTQPRVDLHFHYLDVSRDQAPFIQAAAAAAADDYSPPPPSIHLLRFAATVRDIGDMKKNVAAFVDGVFWMCRPQFILVKSTQNKSGYKLFCEHMCRVLVNRNHRIPDCCGGDAAAASTGKCWRCDLKHVTV